MVVSGRPARAHSREQQSEAAGQSEPQRATARRRLRSFGSGIHRQHEAFKFGRRSAEGGDAVAATDAPAPTLCEPGSRSLGTWFHLVSTSAVAAAIVAVFFGIGLLSLIEAAQGMRHPARLAALGNAPPPSPPRADAAPPAGRALAAAAPAAFSRLPPRLMPAAIAAPGPSLPEHAASAAAGGTALAATDARLRPPPASEATPAPAMPPRPNLAPSAADGAAAAVAPPHPPPRAAVPSDTPPRLEPRLPAVAVTQLLARGDAFLRAGDVASARLYYERAADTGDGEAALREAATFDPTFLASVGLPGTLGDPARAHLWYARTRRPKPGGEVR
jgi:hypothetical protein